MNRRLAAHDRWFYYSQESGYFVCAIDNPTAHPGFGGWHSKLNPDGCVTSEHPIVVIDGRTLLGTGMKATQNDNILCASSCQTAKEPFCSCACGGKNHGILHRAQEEDDD